MTDSENTNYTKSSSAADDIVVGIDAGGTKTRIIVSTTKGKQLADVTGQGTVMTPGNADACADTLAAQIELALAAAEAQYKPKLIYAGVAGVGREAEQVALQIALSDKELAEEVIVDTDAAIALADAFGEKSGVILIAGTGSIAFGRSPAGVEVRCGGWGLAIGDEGSGAWIGRKALSCIAAAHDGREPTTALTGAILTATELNDSDELIPWAIAANKEALAALVPSVVAVAMQEDLRANAIVDIAVEELVLHVKALARRLFIDERASFELALTGGLMSKGSLIRKRLEKRLKLSVPGAEIKASEVIGARGAISLAIKIVNPMSTADKIRSFQQMPLEAEAAEGAESQLDEVESELEGVVVAEEVVVSEGVVASEESLDDDQVDDDSEDEGFTEEEEEEEEDDDDDDADSFEEDEESDEEGEASDEAEDKLENRAV